MVFASCKKYATILKNSWLFITMVFLSSCATMTEIGNPMSPVEDIVQRQLDAYNAHDLSAFVATYSDRVVLYRAPATNPAITGKQALADFYRDFRFNRPALHAELVHRSVIGNKVVDHERITGLRDEPVEAVAVYIVNDKLIESVWLFTAD